MLVELTRSGKIRATSMIPNPQKCAAMRTKTYPYWVRIEGSDRKLSPEGYLFNNERIQSYFDNRFGHLAKPWHAESCENMALEACKDLSSLMLAEGIDVRCVECQILGSNGAKIRGIWNAPETEHTDHERIPQEPVSGMRTGA